MSILSRRNLLRGSAGVLASLATDIAKSQAAVPFLAPEGMDRLEAIMAANEVIIVKDITHDLIKETFEFYGSEAFLTAAKKADVRTIGNELPPSYQPYIDAYQRSATQGTIEEIAREKNKFSRFLDKDLHILVLSDAQTKQVADAFIWYVGQAAKAGIKVIAEDVLNNDKKINGLVKNLIDAENDLSGDSFFSFLHSRGSSISRIKSLERAIVEERISPRINQPAVDLLLAEKKRRGGRLLVTFGAAHGPTLLSEFQAAGCSVTRLALHESKQTLEYDKIVLSEYVDYDKDNNFLLSNRHFADDPEPTARLRKPHHRTRPGP